LGAVDYLGWTARQIMQGMGANQAEIQSDETLGTAEKWMIKQNEGVEMCLIFWPISSNIYPIIVAGH
jgi:hypothetical protein